MELASEYRNQWLFLGLLALLAPLLRGESAEASPYSAESLMVVDCLLPGQVRRLGSITYIAARKAIKTGAGECEKQGGEYVAFDRASVASTLRAWLPLAEQGDAQAQTYVGEAFEKQQDSTDTKNEFLAGYSAAAHWYLKAAEQNHARAAINLGNLFAQGMGVEQDKQMAEFWYHKAAELYTAIPKVDNSSDKAKENGVGSKQTNTDQSRSQKRTHSKYQALVIGNNHYQKLPELDTAVNDANAIADLLRERYGFEVEILIDANRFDVLSALHKLKENYGVETRLLIYYAGHGELDRVNKRGHWLPIDALPDNSTNWISNIAITDLLNIIPARQLMVIADSCYSGMMSRSALGMLDASMSNLEREELLHSLKTARTRTVLTSGGVAPVIDGLGGEHSVFARELIAVLSSNTGDLSGYELFNRIAPKVTAAAASVGFTQVPEYAPLQFSGHEAGDFVFTRI
ncbi:MAG: caspase family protein [Halioglobus sp.]